MNNNTHYNIAIVVLGIAFLGGIYFFMSTQRNPLLSGDTSPTVTRNNEQAVPAGRQGTNNNLDDVPTKLPLDTTSSERKFEQAFIRDGLETNTAIRSIDLRDVLGGGPGKDGIPSIDEPKFTSIAGADSTVTDETLGLFVEADGVKKFYPYNILVWHEIVNDVVGNTPLVVTFCPLCGSAIVFDATFDGEVHEFGVSGKLYDSNLLMYDRKTESLWSQIIGEAVVGDETGKTLKIYPSQIITLAQLKASHPTAQVLSPDTGYSRNYNFYPYGDYDNNDTLFFPVSVNDSRLPAKTIMHIVNTDNGESIAFDRVKLVEAGEAIVTRANGTQVIASVKDKEITVTYANDPSGQEIPGYTAMWFSWAAHHQEDGLVWSPDLQ